MFTQRSYRFGCIALGAAAIFGLAATHAHASVIVLQDGQNGYSGTSDTYLNNQAHRDYNYSGKGRIEVGDQYYSPHTLIRFDLSGVSAPAGQSLESATLSIYQYYNEEDSTASYDVPIRRLLRDWVEGQATWDDASTGTPWAQAGASGDGTDRVATPTDTTTLAKGATQYYNWEVTSDVQAFMAGTDTNHGWVLSTPTSEAFAYFYSSRKSHDRPKLTLTFAPVPEPASAWLVLVGAGGLLLGSRFWSRRGTRFQAG